MYNQYFGFSEEPFNLTPDPDFLFMAVTHREGLSTMMSGIERRMGLITITGDVGTGKTTLIYTLLKDLGGRLRTVFIFNPRLTFRQLVKTILLDLKVPVAKENTFTLLQKFKEFLRERLDEDETVVIIIDEAHQLSARVLNDLAWFLEEDYPALKLLQILLVGQSELEPKLDSEELRLLKKKITVQYRLLHLNSEESKAYIDHRLKVVGSNSSKIFTPDAVDLICEYAKGIPRIINKLCDAALFAGYDTSTPRINAAIVKDVIAKEELAYKEEEETLEEEAFAEKEDLLPQGAIVREEIGEEKETALEGTVAPQKISPREPLEGMEKSTRPPETGLQRARSLFKKIGTGALSLGRGAVFALLHRPEGRKS
ncbi:MAG: AAA family ATPase [Syntrophaceae bacterium]|nr:AAA family ATPase [Syntrophaceae bacterium]